MTTKIKTLKNHEGMDVPVSAINKMDLQKDKAAKQMLKKFIAESDRLKKLKEWAFDKADALYEQQLKYYEFEGRNTEKMKGNFTFYAYDKSIKIEVNVGQRIEFDDRITLAKAEIDEYLKEITEGQNTDIVTIVNHAFTTVRGKLDHKRIFQLMSYKIKHPRWNKAIDLLKESISHNHSKRYIKVWQRDRNGEYQPVIVQFSSL